jgi:site-specific DNA-methyltransferase (adenine-specific)
LIHAFSSLKARINMTHAPGAIRDSIEDYLRTLGSPATLAQISQGVINQIGYAPTSSIRSSLNLHVGTTVERVGRGKYRFRGLATQPADGPVEGKVAALQPAATVGKSILYRADCFEWLTAQPDASIHACVTDPPYGIAEYTGKEQAKLRAGKGGIWRIPPSFDGHQRSPLPRFTVMTEEDRKELYAFFKRLGLLLARVMVPGGNIIVASNPLLSHIVSSAMSEGGLELRGNIVRLVMTMRGGDRPKNAHHEFDGISVMPRSMFEPWVVLRRPVEGRVQDNLRKYKTGGFRRPSKDRPFGDVIPSRPTLKAERNLAPHPSLKPQSLMRKLVRAALPLGEGIVLDPFAGSGSTLAAVNFLGYKSIGIESDPKYVQVAMKGMPKLSVIDLVDPV